MVSLFLSCVLMGAPLVSAQASSYSSIDQQTSAEVDALIDIELMAENPDGSLAFVTPDKEIKNGGEIR